MAYDEFSGSSFDLNHDGNIDCGEASFIEDTYYGDHYDSSSDSDDLCVGYRTGQASTFGEHYASEENKSKVRGKEAKSDFIMAIIIFVVIIAIMMFVGLAI